MKMRCTHTVKETDTENYSIESYGYQKEKKLHEDPYEARKSCDTAKNKK